MVYGCWLLIPFSLRKYKKLSFIIMLPGSALVIHFKVWIQVMKTSLETQAWQFYSPCLPILHPQSGP